MGELRFPVLSFGQALVGQHTLKLYTEVTTKVKGISSQKHQACATKRQSAKQSAFSDRQALRDPVHLGRALCIQETPCTPDTTAHSVFQSHVVIELPRAYLAQLTPHTDASICYFIGEDEIQLAVSKAQGAGLG